MKAQAGFTLLELLVSMTLLALLFVLLFGGLRFGMRAWEHGGTTADNVESVRIVQDLVRGEIERTCPRRLPAQPQQIPRVDFSGERAALGFLAPAPGSAGGARCVLLTLTVKPDGPFERLVLGLGVNRQETDLLRHAQSIELSYLATGGAWQGSWRGQTDLPALVRLRVTFPPGDTRQWPELFVSPRISAEADCTYDDATKSCRGG
ncbi:MAG TPA: prepilin-type N-terminal cleavage/methylation domain-containing protein [Rhizomicrobium sp.]|jgi:general secretion pathway protein J|nr:prepilin-type N-terminal cleavage/methylation domain-containing protein [Rhizomicrobium sp.]